MNVLHCTFEDTFEVMTLLDDLSLFTERCSIPDDRKGAYMNVFGRYSSTFSAQRMCIAIEKVIDTWEESRMPSIAHILSMLPYGAIVRKER